MEEIVVVIGREAECASRSVRLGRPGEWADDGFSRRRTIHLGSECELVYPLARGEG